MKLFYQPWANFIYFIDSFCLYSRQRLASQTLLSAFKYALTLLLVAVISLNGWGQTNPAAFDLSVGNFSFTTQTATNTVYPTNMQGWTTGTNNLVGITTAAPGADQALIASGTAATSGLSNLGANGFNLLVTGAIPQVGEIAVALNTTGRTSILVTWTAADQTTGATRQMNMTLQYRIGTSGVFTTVASSTYTTSNSSQAAGSTFTNISLPGACDNQPVVQIRWVTYESAAQSGGRDAIRLDDITVSSSSMSTNYYWNGSNASVLNGNWDNAATNWTSPTATATPNIAWPSTGTNNANFNGAGGGIVTLTGAIAITPSVINIGSNAYTFAAPASTVTSLGGTIGLNANTLTLAPAAGGSIALSGIINGTGSITQNGAGTTTLSGVNTYSGSTNISQGTLSAATIVVAAGASNLGNAASAVTLGSVGTSGTLSYTGAATTYTRGFSVAAGGGGITNTSGNLLTIATGGIVNGGALNFSNTGAGGTTVSSIISSTGSVTVNNTGAGITIFSGANTYSSGTTINAGKLQMGAANSMPSVGAVSLANVSGAIFDLNGNSQTIASLSGGGTTGGNVTLGSATLTVNGSSSTSYDGVISGTGALLKSGSSMLTLTNATNSYTGTTTITGGELRLNPVSTPASMATQVVMNGGTLSTTGIANNSTIITNSSTLKLSVSSTLALDASYGHQLKFAASNAVAWTGVLTITGWQGAYDGTTGTMGRLFVGTNTSGLTGAQLLQIQFFDGSSYYPATIITGGEVVATQGTITTGTATYGPFCNSTNNNLSVSYTTLGTFLGSFYVQISDASGLFPADVVTNIISAAGTSPITATIPSGQPTGTGYRVRVVNSSPPTQSSNDNGNNIIVYSSAPATPGTITEPGTVPCALSTGNSYSISPVANATSYLWGTTGTGWSASGTGLTGTVTVGSVAGTVTVAASNICGTSPAQTTASITPGTVPGTPTFTATTSTNNVVSPIIGGTTYTYQVTSTGATGFVWSVSGLTGWSITAGTGTSTITVTIGSGSGNVTVYATNGCGNSGLPVNFAVTPTVGTFYSQAGGNPATLTNWNSVRGGGGFTPGSTTAGNFVIQNGHNMTTTGTITFGQSGTFLQIESGGTLTANSAVTVPAGATFKLDDGGTYIHNNTGTLATTIFAGTEQFGAASTFEIQRWETLTTSITPASLTASITAGGNNYYYGNLNINYTTLGTGKLSPAFTGNVYLCAGSLSINSTGTYVAPPTFAGTYGTSGAILFSTAAAGANIYVLGNYSQINSTYVNFNNNASQTTSSTILYLSGNYTIGNAALDNTGAKFAAIVFNKASATQTVNVSTSAYHYYVNFTAGTGTSTNTVQLSTNSLSGTLAQLSILTVAASATFDMNALNLKLDGASAGTLTVNGTLLGSTGIMTANLTGYIVTVSSTGTFKTKNTSGFSGGASTAISSTNTPTVTLSSGSTVEYNGTAASQVLTGANNYSNLVLNNSLGYTMTADATVTANLALTQGKVVTGAYKMISTSGTVNGAASTSLPLSGLTSYINGKMQMPFAAGTLSQIFPIGDASAYAPVSLTLASVSSAGGIIASTTNTAQANFATAQIDQAKYVKRTWTLANNGTAFTTFSGTFNFVTGDIQSGANTANFIGGVYSGSWTYPAVGTKTGTSTQLTGCTILSDYMVGEQPPTCTSPDAVAFVTQPSNVVQDATMSTVVVKVYCSATGVLANAYNGLVTIKAPGGAGGCGLNGSTGFTATAVNGIATFNNLVFTRSVQTGITVTASAASVAGTATSNTFNVTVPAGSPTSAVIAKENFDAATTWTYVTGTPSYTGSGSGADLVSIKTFSGNKALTKSYTTDNAADEKRSTNTITFANYTWAAATYDYATFKFTLGSLGAADGCVSNCISGGGADGVDNMFIEISLDGGTVWSKLLTINGNNDYLLPFQVGTVTSLANGANVTYTKPSALSTFKVQLPSSATQFRFRMTATNNRTNENWAIDSITLIGTQIPIGSPSPLPTVTSSSITDCPNAGKTISVVTSNTTGAVTYAWTPATYISNTTVPNPTVNPPSTTVYNVTVTDADLCTGTGSVTVNIPSGAAGTWTGNVSIDWFDCLNWANGIVPDNTVNVSILNSAVNLADIDSLSPYASAFSYMANSNNITIDNKTLKLEDGAVLNTNGNLVIQNSGLTDMTNGGKINLKGNWTNTVGTAGFTEGIGTVNMIGTASLQTTNTNGIGGEGFYNLTINNANGVTLSKDASVANTFTLTNGIVNTTAAPNGLLTLGTAALVAGSPGTSSFVNGPMAKNTNTAVEFEFPVGKTSASIKYRPTGIVPSTTTATTYTAEYMPGSPVPYYYNILSPYLFGVQNNEYWQVDRSAGGSPARVKINYIYPGTGPTNWAPIDPCSDCAVGVVHLNSADYWELTAAAGNFNASIPEARLYTSNGVIYSTVWNNFSPFTAGYGASSVLPVVLLTFDAILKNTEGILHWTIANDKYLASFEVQYSKDAVNFVSLGNVKVNGTGIYNFTHPSLLSGSHYYRILVKQKTGNSFLSAVKVLTLDKMTTQITQVIHKQGGSVVTPHIYSAVSQKAGVTIIDAGGRLIGSQTTMLRRGDNEWNISLPTLAAGIYFLTVTTDDGLRQTEKWIK